MNTIQYNQSPSFTSLSIKNLNKIKKEYGPEVVKLLEKDRTLRAAGKKADVSVSLSTKFGFDLDTYSMNKKHDPMVYKPKLKISISPKNASFFEKLFNSKVISVKLKDYENPLYTRGAVNGKLKSTLHKLKDKIQNKTNQVYLNNFT